MPDEGFDPFRHLGVDSISPSAVRVQSECLSLALGRMNMGLLWTLRLDRL